MAEKVGKPQKTHPGARRALTDVFPFGAAPLVILLLTLAAGAYLLFHPVRTSTADLTLWTFAAPHYEAYFEARNTFLKTRPGRSVDVQLVHGDAVTSRLRSAFWANTNVPDMVEVEITRAGSFFRGPAEDIGFVDLTPYLEKSGLMDSIVRTRLTPYSHRGRIYGLPHDVHPVMLAYRKDIFDELGIDASKLTTWDKFIEVGRRITRREGEEGTDAAHPPRYMINLSKKQAYSFEVLLFQRGGDYFDHQGRLTMDSDLALDTLRWYTRLIAGPQRIAADPDMFGQGWVTSVQDGYCLAFICPDWKSKSTELQIASMAGKMALMPLPAFEPGGRRTSTWGGTMLGITEKCPNKQLAWEFAKHLYFDPAELAERFRGTNILPPYRDAWENPAFHEPRPYWGGGSLPVTWVRTDPAEGHPVAGVWKAGNDGQRAVIEADANGLTVAGYHADGTDAWSGKGTLDAHGRLEATVFLASPRTDARGEPVNPLRRFVLKLTPAEGDKPAVLAGQMQWGQQLGTAYIGLADQVPPQHGSPFLEFAKGRMSKVVAACRTYYDRNGENGFEEFSRARLRAAAQEVRRQMQRNPF
ncbi:MAG: ABC transporter substrate-binding protein [Phycisphaerae bacterium]